MIGSTTAASVFETLGVLRLEIHGSWSVADLIQLLRRLEDGYEAAGALQSLIAESEVPSRRMQSESLSADDLLRAVTAFQLAGGLRLGSLRYGSPGFLEVIGALNPLKVLKDGVTENREINRKRDETRRLDEREREQQAMSHTEAMARENRASEQQQQSHDLKVARLQMQAEQGRFNMMRDLIDRLPADLQPVAAAQILQNLMGVTEAIATDARVDGARIIEQETSVRNPEEPPPEDYAGNVPSSIFRSNVQTTASVPLAATNVTYERILRARSEPQNWLTHYGAYDGQRYSTLSQISTENVERLTPSWAFRLGSDRYSHASTGAFATAPVVVDGMMFITGWNGRVKALNAATGELLWDFNYPITHETSLIEEQMNGGVAVAGRKVFFVTPDAHLVALDASNGQLVWEKTFGDARAGEGGTLAPLIVKNLVIVGNSGWEFGVRGHLDAFEMETGEHIWRQYTVPEPGDPGADTWPTEGKAWGRGGANCRNTCTYDPELNLLFVGTGSPMPDFDGEIRPGDNLYANSLVAIDADSGHIRFHYQYIPHNVWGYGSVSEHILFEMDGRKVMAHFDESGYCFILDRVYGQLIRVFPFVHRITWGEIDASGKITPKLYPGNGGESIHFWPGPIDGRSGVHAAYSPETGLLYAPVQDIGATVRRFRRTFKGDAYWGADVQVDTEDIVGSVSAFDPRTGKEVWRWRSDVPVCASVLATGGNLVFVGGLNGFFYAFNARSGELLYQFRCGSGHHSNPITYSIDDRQYVAVPAVLGADPAGGMGEAALIVFALPEYNEVILATSS